jgi:hypothetical protein
MRLLLFILLLIPATGMSQDFYDVEYVQTCQDSMSHPSEIIKKDAIIQKFPEKLIINIDKESWEYVIKNEIPDNVNNRELWYIKKDKTERQILVITTRENGVIFGVYNKDMGFARFFTKKINYLK